MHIIVGAGIAGLWIADQMVAAGIPGRQITILEKYDYIGGRIVSHTKDDLVYEIGAGRIHESHHRVQTLIKRFGLTWRPNGAAIDWRPLGSKTQPNRFDDAMGALIPVLSVLPASDLATHTISELLRRIMGPAPAALLLEKYPYRAEVERLRADIALSAFKGEMGTHKGYGSIVGGLSGITRGLATSLRAAGVRIRTGYTVTNVTGTAAAAAAYEVHVKEREKPLKAERVILALHATALRKLPVVRDAEPLKHLVMAPLTRIYAQYPADPDGSVWFTGIPRTVTDSPLRHIIPIDPAIGLIMISYTDDRDTAAWTGFIGLKGSALTTAIQKEVRALWPALEIPEPLWVRPYEWTEGCTYWRPGLYDPVVMSRAAMHPRPSTMPGLYMCGESFHVGQQAWIEGALSHAEELWRTFLR
jgi:hypothetical protein